jgi:hypothetical protein
MDLLTFLRHQWDRVGAWVCICVGAILLLVGWIGASRQVLPAAQIPYVISGGLGGVFLLGLGAVLWLSADLRDEWRQLHEIAGRLEGGDAEDELRRASSVKGNGAVDRAPATTSAP